MAEGVRTGLLNLSKNFYLYTYPITKNCTVKSRHNSYSREVCSLREEMGIEQINIPQAYHFKLRWKLQEEKNGELWDNVAVVFHSYFSPRKVLSGKVTFKVKVERWFWVNEVERGSLFQIERTVCAKAQGRTQLGMFQDMKEAQWDWMEMGRMIRDEWGRWARMCCFFACSIHSPSHSVLSCASWPTSVDSITYILMASGFRLGSTSALWGWIRKWWRHQSWYFFPFPSCFSNMVLAVA